jgi:hypothetical protein
MTIFYKKFKNRFTVSFYLKYNSTHEHWKTVDTTMVM